MFWTDMEAEARRIKMLHDWPPNTKPQISIEKEYDDGNSSSTASVRRSTTDAGDRKDHGMG
jgi:hypothetical protein